MARILHEVIAALSAFALLVWYHHKLWYQKSRGKPFLPKIPGLSFQHSSTVGTRHASSSIKTAWVQEVQNKGMIAVNTLRDSQRQGFYNGNTAILLCTLVVGYAFSRFEECWPALHELSEEGTFSEALGHCSSAKQFCLLKLSLIAANLWTIWHNFSQNVRFITNLQFAINCREIDGWEVPADVPQAYMQRAGQHLHLGMRGWYLMVPLAAWLFGPWQLLIVTIGTVFFLHHMDHFSGLVLPSEIPFGAAGAVGGSEDLAGGALNPMWAQQRRQELGGETACGVVWPSSELI
jgi:hypothetical protein